MDSLKLWNVGSARYLLAGERYMGARRRAATEPGLLIYIMVGSIAATINAVIANGGKIVQSIGADAPEVTARFSDPAGNVTGLYRQST